MRMQVKVRVPCTDCEGGIMEDPTWVECNAAFRDANPAEADTQRRFRQWWRSRGFDPDQLPPEEFECCECDGTLWVEKWIDLAELVRQPEMVMLSL